MEIFKIAKMLVVLAELIFLFDIQDKFVEFQPKFLRKWNTQKNYGMCTKNRSLLLFTLYLRYATSDFDRMNGYYKFITCRVSNLYWKLINHFWFQSNREFTKTVPVFRLHPVLREYQKILIKRLSLIFHYIFDIPCMIPGITV